LPANPKPHIIEVTSYVPFYALTNIFLAKNCREENGEHTCDKRRTRSEIQHDFPNFDFEEGFDEEDVLWSLERETKKSVERRAKLVLDRIFDNDRDETCACTLRLSRATKMSSVS
jgi:hypothetical protein